MFKIQAPSTVSEEAAVHKAEHPMISGGARPIPAGGMMMGYPDPRLAMSQYFAMLGPSFMMPQGYPQTFFPPQFMVGMLQEGLLQGHSGKDKATAMMHGAGTTLPGMPGVVATAYPAVDPTSFPSVVSLATANTEVKAESSECSSTQDDAIEALTSLFGNSADGPSEDPAAKKVKKLKPASSVSKSIEKKGKVGGERVGAGRPKLRMGGECADCGATKTPRWRQGPPHAPLLCNACGLRYVRSKFVGSQR